MGGGAHSPHVPTVLRCSRCGAETRIWRKQGRRRERGHVKHLWCFSCQETTAHVEVGEEGESWNSR